MCRIQKKDSRIFYLFASFIFVLSISAEAPAYASDDRSTVKYVYEDTKRLVKFVENAAELIEKKGGEAFKEFGDMGSKWFSGKQYLFVYDLDGVCVFHPIETNFVGLNMSVLKDIEGRSVISMITDVVKKPESDASGWVFYLWEDPSHSYPKWKGSFIRKAVSPDGRVYAVGSGLYYLKTEKIFIQESVDKAVGFINSLGKDEAFRRLRENSCPLHIFGSYISVVDENGDVIVDPLFPNIPKKRNIINYRDVTGKDVFKETKDLLAVKDGTWIMSVEATVDSDRPVRNLKYIRKVTVGREAFYVSSSFVPAIPVWMK